MPSQGPAATVGGGSFYTTFTSKSGRHVGKCIKELRQRLAFGRLMAEARVHEDNGELQDARTGYRKASAAAPDAKAKQKAQSRLSAVEKRIMTGEAVAAVVAKVEAKDWRGAWKLIEDARTGGISDTRLSELRRQEIEALAPPPEVVRITRHTESREAVGSLLSVSRLSWLPRS